MKDPEDDSDEKERERSGLDRRQFGKVLTAGIGGLTLVRPGAMEAQETPPEKPVARSASGTQFTHDVVIVGAGLSGLIAARELLKADKCMKVLVLEASSDIGGRMVRKEVMGGGNRGYVDLGGQWVGETQDEMKALVAELGIKPFLSYEKGRSIKVVDGKTANPDAGRTNWDGDVAPLLEGNCHAPHDFPPNADRTDCHPVPANNCVADATERKVWGSSLDPFKKYAGQGVPSDPCKLFVDSLLDLSRNIPPDRPWDTQNALALDNQTFGKWLACREQDNTGYTAWLPRFQARIGGSGGFEPDQVSLLHMAWTQRVNPQSETPEKWLLCGAAGQIPPILEGQLPKNTVQKNSPVTRISQIQTNGENDGVEVVMGGGRRRTGPGP